MEIRSYFNADFRLLMYVILGFLLVAAVGCAIEEKYFKKEPAIWLV